MRKLYKIRRAIKRMNQVILALPVWAVIGASGIFRNSSENIGWNKSEKNDQYRRMY